MKVVINNCFGGFGLSMAAIKRIAALQGRNCYFFESNLYKPYKSIKESNEPSLMWVAFDIPNPNEILHNEEKRSMSTEERQAHNKKYEKHAIGDYRDDRTNKLLVQVVEELGEKANGMCASLSVVEIPDDVEWEIDEYDGSETIHEKHRSWS